MAHSHDSTALDLPLPARRHQTLGLVLVRRLAGHGLHDARATMLALDASGTEFRRLLVLARALVVDLAREQMVATGPIFAMDVGDRATAFRLLDALELVDISNNIGDARSLMCHPASTTHAGMTQEARDEMGVTEGLLRINVGLEDVEDLKEDLDRALAAAGL